MNRKPCVLAVDDNGKNLEIIEEILGEEFDVRSASSGKEALVAAATLKPALVLLDVMMPTLNGYEVCEEIRKHPALRHTKILMVSAKTLIHDRIRGFEAGADDYITKPFEAEELLFKARVFVKLRNAEEIDQLKTNVLSLFAHEVRTPLNCLILPADLLRAEDDFDEEERRRLAEIIYRNAVGLHSFFEKALALGSMRSGQWMPVLESLPLDALIDDARAKVEGLAGERGVVIDVDCEEGIVLFADQREFLRVIVSLLDNAVRHTPEGGRVEVRVCTGETDVSIEVTDRGEGIPRDHFDEVFEGLVDLDSDHHTSGHGLSLALAREIVDGHGGSIRVESEEGDGATFSVSIPLALATQFE